MNDSIRGKQPLSRMKARRMKEAGTYVYLAPAAVLLALVFALPLIWSVAMSLQQSAGILGTSGWAGLENYATVLSRPKFWAVSGQTVIWTVGVLTVTTVVSLVLALLLKRPFRGRTLVRVLLMLPWASALSISAVVWTFGLREQGLVNETLRALGLEVLIQDWLVVPPESTVVLILIGSWASIPFTVMMLSAAIKSIPQEVFEAVSLETSNPLVRDWYITIPLLKRMIQITLMSNAIVVFNSFPMIMVLTGGGPANKTDILATYLYKLAFKNQEFGEASAIAVIVSIALILPAIIYARQIIGPSPQAERKQVTK